MTVTPSPPCRSGWLGCLAGLGEQMDRSAAEQLLGMKPAVVMPPATSTTIQGRDEENKHHAHLTTKARLPFCFPMIFSSAIIASYAD